jgi:hypothetical protein
MTASRRAVVTITERAIFSPPGSASGRSKTLATDLVRSAPRAAGWMNWSASATDRAVASGTASNRPKSVTVDQARFFMYDGTWPQVRWRGPAPREQLADGRAGSVVLQGRLYLLTLIGWWRGGERD